METDDRLQEAKNRYPPGTVYDSLTGFDKMTVLESDNIGYNDWANKLNITIQTNKGSNKGTLYSHSKGLWATILSKSSINNSYSIY